MAVSLCFRQIPWVVSADSPWSSPSRGRPPPACTWLRAGGRGAAASLGVYQEALPQTEMLSG